MTRSQTLTVIITLIMEFISTAAFAQLNERREFYKNSRYLAMGGAMVAIANDETAIGANPAGLGRLRDAYGTMIDPEIEISSQAVSAYNSKAFTDPSSLKQAVDTMVTRTDKFFTSRVQFMPSFVAKNFGLALIKKTDLQVRATSATAVDAFYRDDMGLLLGYNLRLFEGRIKIGVTGKLISRIEVNETGLNPTTQSMGLKSLAAAGFATAGTGFGFDGGILLAAPWKWLPTIGAVYRDVGGMQFKQTTFKRLTGAPDPDAVTGDIDVGVSLFPIHSNNVRSSIALEYRGLLSSETDKQKLMHFGYELNYADVLFLRAGYNQRYWTAGFELASESMQFQFSSYGEEVGTQSSPKEDRRWILKIAYRF